MGGHRVPALVDGGGTRRCPQQGGGGDSDREQSARGEDEVLKDDDGAEKYRNSVTRAKTNDRTIVPTDVKAWFIGVHEPRSTR